MTCTPEWAEPITGIPAETIKKVARIYATNKPSAIIYSMGITQRACGTDNVLCPCPTSLCLRAASVREALA